MRCHGLVLHVVVDILLETFKVEGVVLFAFEDGTAIVVGHLAIGVDGVDVVDGELAVGILNLILRQSEGSVVVATLGDGERGCAMIGLTKLAVVGILLTRSILVGQSVGQLHERIGGVDGGCVANAQAGCHDLHALHIIHKWGNHGRELTRERVGAYENLLGGIARAAP